MANGSPTYWRISEPDVDIGWETASRIWAEASIPFLKALAGMKHNYITYGTWADYVQEQTGVETSRYELTSWPGQVLGQVLNMCSDQGRPALSSLVVNQDNGMCGTGFGAYHDKYDFHVHKDDPKKLMKLEEFAAILRLECYKEYARPLDESRAKWEPFHTPTHLKWRSREGWPPPGEGN